MIEELKSMVPRSMKGWVVFLIVMVWLPQLLYDYLLKPGLGGINAWAFDILATVFKQFRDSAYENAALDPTVLPSLYIFLFLSASPVIALSVFMRKLQSRHIRLNNRANNIPTDHAGLSTELARLDRRLAVFRVAVMIWLIICGALLLSQFLIVNRSLVVWRTFNTDMSALAPHMSDVEVKQLRSQFSQMRTERDYEIIIKELSHRTASARVKMSSSPP